MLNVPTNCDIYDTEFSPHKWFVNFVKEDVHKELLEHWPNAKLFKDEGNEKPRKHGQRNHIRKFMCYANFTPNKMLQKFMIDTKNIPEVWHQFVANGCGVGLQSRLNIVSDSQQAVSQCDIVIVPHIIRIWASVFYLL